jgi:zinc transport system substrate-binding protein
VKFREWLIKKSTITLLIIIFAALAAWQVVQLNLAPPQGQAPLPGGLVVTGTTQLADTARTVGGDRVRVVNFVPAGTCPGQADVKPSDLDNLRQARLLLIHDFQQAQSDMKALTASASNKDLITRVIAAPGGLMTPSYQSQLADLVEGALIENDPAGAFYYRDNAQRRRAEIASKAAEVQARFKTAGVNGVKVVAMLHQADFLKWAGFNVVATYGPPETITPAVLADAIRLGKAAGARLVVDNLQSGPDSGQSVARDLNVPRVTISNFPGALPGTDTWGQAADENARLILAVLGVK